MSEKNFKLLMICGLFHPEVGGTEKACQRISKKLKELGYDVAVLTRYREGIPAYEMIDGFPVYRYIKGWHFFEFTYMLSVLSFLIRYRHNIDGILCFGLYLFTAPAVIFCRLTGRRVFFRLGSAGEFKLLSQLKWHWFILKFAKLANAVIALSREIEEEIIRNSFPKKKIIRIPNSVDTKEFLPGLQKDEEPFVICYVGRLAPGKGLETFIKALAGLGAHTKKFKVLIVGDGELKTSLTEQVKNQRLERLVSFVGKVDNVVPYYHRSHVFVLPSVSEGMPLSLLEAMACGLCVVATSVGGIVDLVGETERHEPVDDGYQVCRNGIMFKPGDEQALSSALLRLKSDLELRRSLGRNAFKTIEDGYALESVIKRYIDLFRS